MCRKDLPCREELGLLILRTATMIRRKADSNIYMSKVHKITGSNGWILGYLADHENEEIYQKDRFKKGQHWHTIEGAFYFYKEGTHYQKDIEEKFCVTRSTVSKVLKGMESKGLLRRESVSSDARLKRLVLTEEGREINANAAVERIELENRIRNGLSDEEFHTLMHLLKRVADNMLEE